MLLNGWRLRHSEPTLLLSQHILIMFRCPFTLILNEGVHFINDVINYFIEDFLMKHVNSTTIIHKEMGKHN
jgi:hypothetical protein